MTNVFMKLHYEHFSDICFFVITAFKLILKETGPCESPLKVNVQDFGENLEFDLTFDLKRLNPLSCIDG